MAYQSKQFKGSRIIPIINLAAAGLTSLFSRFLWNIQRMTVTITVAVTFHFSFFSGLKSQGERIRLGSENDWNGTLFILKEEKREKEGWAMAWKQVKSLIFSYFFVSLFFLFLGMGWQEFFNGSRIGTDFYVKKSLGERIPQGSDIDIFCVFSDGSGKN